MSRKERSLARRARRWLLTLGVIQLLLRFGGQLAARRRDEGDESSARLRRVGTLGAVSLSPVSQGLAAVGLDLVLAGAELDLTGARPASGGVDLTLTCVLAGCDVRVPADWRVSWDRRGIGGVAPHNQRVSPSGQMTGHQPDERDPDTADLRIHLRALFGGVNLLIGPSA
jgi:hypothetical protein